MSRFGYVMTTYFAMLAVGVLAFFHPALDFRLAEAMEKAARAH